MRLNIKWLKGYILEMVEEEVWNEFGCPRDSNGKANIKHIQTQIDTAYQATMKALKEAA